MPCWSDKAFLGTVVNCINRKSLKIESITVPLIAIHLSIDGLLLSDEEELREQSDDLDLETPGYLFLNI